MAQIIVASEHEEQAAFVEGVLYQYLRRQDFIRPLFFMVPNGAWMGDKAPLVIRKLKLEGFVNGVSDILYLQPRGEFPYFVCEMKRQTRKNEKNGGVTEDEMEWLKAARKAGAFVTVAYGADDALREFGNYMQLEAVAGVQQSAIRFE